MARIRGLNSAVAPMVTKQCFGVFAPGRSMIMFWGGAEWRGFASGDDGAIAGLLAWYPAFYDFFCALRVSADSDWPKEVIGLR